MTTQKKKRIRIDLSWFIFGWVVLIFGFALSSIQISVLITAIGGFLIGMGVRDE